MKKMFFVLIVVLFGISLFGCDKKQKIKEYEGTPLTHLIYESIDYNGGAISEYRFDFNENSVRKSNYLPSDESNPIYETIAEFNDQQEQVLINKLYSYGLFDIKDEYESSEVIVDGGGWNLEIQYADGTNKISQGSNNRPEEVFNDCAKAFYDICKHGIVAYVPVEYYLPPNVSYSIKFTVGNSTTSQGNGSFTKRGNYKWNGFEESSCDIFQLNQEYEIPFELNDSTKYKLVLYTANYGNYDRFKKCEVTSYDYNEEMTTKKKIIEKGWFKQIEFDLKLNKIYVLKLSFANGDFAEYTFNTKI